MNDLVIRGVLIVNKSGSEPATGDIGIREGVIGTIYERGLIDTQEDDGTGFVLAPGYCGYSYALRCAVDVDCK